MLSPKKILSNRYIMAFMKNVAIYLPICMIIFFAVDFAVHRHLKKIETKQQAQEVYFKKYEGSLKRRLNLSLEEAGITREQATKIVNKLNTVLDMRRLAPRDKYLITMAENDNNGFKMLIVTKDFSRYYVAQNNGELIAGIMDISFKERERFVKGDIQNSLFNSMQAVGLKPSFIIDFTDLFSWTIDFNSETRDGDKFALYWEEGYTAGGNTLNETILAAYYDGKVGGRTYAIRFEDDFYDENGKFSKKMFLKSPISVRGVRISSRFNKGRVHPILRIRRPHLGIDYAAPSGTPVESVADGIVKFKGRKGGFGNYLEIAHPNHYVTCYGHLLRFAKDIKVGAKVRQGQTVAYVGSTGLSTGPHLDFRIRQGNKYFDFLNSKQRSSAAREIPASKREEFNKIRDKYIKILNGDQAIEEKP